MLDLMQIAQAAENEDFRRRIKAAIFITASNVLTEPPDTPGNAQRRFLATSAAGAPDTFVWQFSWMCATAPQIRDTVQVDAAGPAVVGASDAVILAATSAAWDVIAGVPAADRLP